MKESKSQFEKLYCDISGKLPDWISYLSKKGIDDTFKINQKNSSMLASGYRGKFENLKVFITL